MIDQLIESRYIYIYLEEIDQSESWDSIIVLLKLHTKMEKTLTGFEAWAFQQSLHQL